MFMESGVGSHCRCGPIGKLPFEHVVPQARDPLYIYKRGRSNGDVLCASVHSIMEL